jgi:hypothetical protein
VNRCQLCGAPGGYPFCNRDCEEAAPPPDVPVYNPDRHNPPPAGDGSPPF